ncbi:MAG: Uma2 family endonuclease [Sphingomonas sp.]|nr:Uma2 family endonuclease [Sphingomonas sp.]
MTLHDRPQPGKYRLTIDDYVALAASGAFGDARTELIDGEVIVMAPEFRRHAFIRDDLAYRLRRALEDLGSDLYAASGSVLVDDHAMPQPDIVLTREPHGDGPIPLASVALVVEVSASTLADDLGRKLALYASAGIPEYWVADVEAKVIHQLWAPEGEAYAQRREVAFGARIEAVTVAGLVVEALQP